MCNGPKNLHLSTFLANVILVQSLFPEKKNISTKFSCVSNFFSLLTNQILKWGMLFSHQWFSYNVQKRNLCWIHVPLSAASLLTKISASFVFETLSCFSLISKDLDALLGLKKFLLKNTSFHHLVASKDFCIKVCIEWRNQEEISNNW